MKKLVLSLLITGTLFSCSHDGQEPDFCSGEIELESQQFPQSWKLVKMTGGMINSETTGSAMAWQETIVLNDDKTFRKVRERDNQATETSGTYALAYDDADKRYQL